MRMLIRTTLAALAVVGWTRRVGASAHADAVMTTTIVPSQPSVFVFEIMCLPR